ncbi:MAG: hypothetical protein GY833_12165 [Aestuariibacter sp.]|nr:hypothetical protein [Aestuariibacter sp.]|tara:strand:+ start:20861 stop:22189 length:1329 start_codon:yes stop_codon:yes gene_type:complete
MIFDLNAFLNASNPVATVADPQPQHDGLMRHGVTLIGFEGQQALREVLKDQALLPETYLAIYVAPKDELDAAGTSFDETYAKTLQPYKFAGNVLVHKATFDEGDKYNYKTLYVDGLLSGKDYYYGVKLFVDGIEQLGFTEGAFTTGGSAVPAPDLANMTIVEPTDHYMLKYNILTHDMAGVSDKLVPRFEVVNKLLTQASAREVIVDRDVYDPTTPSYFEVADVAGGIFDRYVYYDIQVRYLYKTGDGNPVGVSAPTKLATGVQIPWLHNFVDQVILKGGGIDQQILEDAAAKVAQLTPAEREEILEQMSDGDIQDIGTVYSNLLKQAALDNVKSLESECDALRLKLRTALYEAAALQERGKGLYITIDLTTDDQKRVYYMVTSPSNIRGYNVPSFIKFAEGVFYVSDDLDDNGVSTGKTRLTYVGHAAFERFFVDFNQRSA